MTPNAPGRIRWSISTRFALVFAGLVLLTLFGVVLALRQTVITAFTEQYRRTLKTDLDAVRAGLEREREDIREQLRRLASTMSGDYEFRLNLLVRKKTNSPAVVRYAANHLRTMDLDVLEIADSRGVVLSSGHDPYSFGKKRKWLIRDAVMRDSVALSVFEQSGRSFVCLSAVDSVRLANTIFYLVGGRIINPLFLEAMAGRASGTLLAVLPDTVFISDPAGLSETLPEEVFRTGETTDLAPLLEDYNVGRLSVPLVRNGKNAVAWIVLLHSRTALGSVLRALNRNMLLIAFAGMLVAIILGVWVTRTLARPLRRLAEVTGTLSLDTLDARFDLESNDEVGVLNRALDSMQTRLRQNRLQLAAAETKAALAQIARQVNHDIKNGFVPIRNVMRHWQEVAEEAPAELVRIFNERKTSVLDSLAYLEELARGYSRLRPELNVSRVDINELLARLVASYSGIAGTAVRFTTGLDSRRPEVQADRVQLQRAFENILTNAVEAVGGSGLITVETRVANDHVQISFTDDGPGISDALRPQLFQPHVSGKPGGTGLGLATVKSVVVDLGGRVDVESEPSAGATIRLSLPLSST